MGTAERTADFINSIGVNTHLSYNGTSYSAATVIASMQYLGIDHVRDDDLGTLASNPVNLNPYVAVANAGIKFDLYLIPTQSLANELYFANALEAASPGAVGAIEGPNEISNSTSFVTGGTGYAALPAYEQAVYNAVTGDPALAGVSIYANTFASEGPGSNVSGNLSPYVTDGNAHIYFQGAPPVSAMPFIASQTSDTPNDSTVITEAGYASDGVQDSTGAIAVNDDVQAKYTLDLLFDDIQAGVQTVYLYELLDEYNDPNNTSYQNHFGLFNFDGSPKPAAVALHNLTTILADPSATASTFTTGTLNYTVTGLPQYNKMLVGSTEFQNFAGNTYLLEKSSGAYDLAVWAEPSLWNTATSSEMIAPPSLVTVSLGQAYQTIEVFDPMVSTSPIEVLHNVSQVQIVVTDHPIIVEVEPNGVGTNAKAVTPPDVFQMQAAGVGQTFGDNKTLQASLVKITDSASTGAISATIYILNSAGQVTDANGSLAGNGVVKAGVGEYTVTAASASVLSADLQSTVFTPTNHEVAVGQTVTTSFKIVLSDGTNNTVVSSPPIYVVAQETAPTANGFDPALKTTDLLTASPFYKTVIADPDFATAESASITLVNASGAATDANGTLSGTGLTKTGVGTYGLAPASPTALTAELQQLIFTPTAGQVDTGQSVKTIFDLSVTDGTDTVTNNSNAVTVTDTGPVLSGGASVWTNPDGHVPVTVLRALSVTDPQSGGAETAMITLLNASGNPTDANGVLAGAGLTKTATGTYSLTAASPAAMTTALEALTFAPTDHQVAPGQSVVTQISVSVSDGVRTGAVIGATMTAVASEDAPGITGTVGNQTLTDGQTIQPFAAAAITDPDFGAQDSLTISLVNTGGSTTDADGTLSGTGLTKTGTGTYVLAGPPGMVTAELEQLVFKPTLGQVAAGQRVMTYFDLSVTDGTDVAANNATWTNVLAAGPVLSGGVSVWTNPDSHAPMTVLRSLTVTDPQSGGAETATITLLNASSKPTDANGVLAGAGLTKTATGTYSLTAASPAAMTTALEALTFAPTDHQVAPGQSVVTQISVSVSDGVRTGAVIGATMTAVASEDAPGITGTVANQAATDIQTIRPFAGTVISDPDFGTADSVTITLVAGGGATDADGTLSGAGLTKTGTGTYTLAAATPSAVTAELQQLLFTPTAGQVAPGQKVTTTFDLAVSDGTDTTTNTSNSAVVTATGPIVSGVWNGSLADNHAPVTALRNVTVTDSFSNGPETATITLLNAGGTATDANGVLAGTGLTKTATGTYSISAASPAAMTTALQAITFGPTNRQVAPGQSVTTEVAVSVTDGTHIGSDTSNTITAVAAGTSIAAGTNFVLASGATVSNTIYFAGSNATLTVDGTGLPNATITGFDLGSSTGDEIILAGYSYVSGKDTASLVAGNVLSLNLNGTVKTLLLDPTANYAGHSFSIQTNSQDQVVVVDPITGTATPKMSFMAPLPNATGTGAAATALPNKADSFANLFPATSSYRFGSDSAATGADSRLGSPSGSNSAAASLNDLVTHHAASILPISFDAMR